MKSAQKLFKDGAPKYIQVYKAKKKPYNDCWTVVFTKAFAWTRDERFRGVKVFIGMCDNGDYYHGEFDTARYGAPAFGSKMSWNDLTLKQKSVVLKEYCENWSVVVRTCVGECFEAYYRSGLEVEHAPAGASGN